MTTFMTIYLITCLVIIFALFKASEFIEMKAKTY